MDTNLPHVTLEAIAAEDASVLHNLVQLYAHDFSEYVPLQLASNGRFDVVIGDSWWTTDDHFPFFILTSGNLAGFALIRKGSRTQAADDVMDIAEFFVVRGARGKKVGRAAAHALFRHFPGKWEIRVRKSNPLALEFWVGAIESWSREPPCVETFTDKGVEWDMLRIGRSEHEHGAERAP